VVHLVMHYHVSKLANDMSTRESQLVNSFWPETLLWAPVAKPAQRTRSEESARPEASQFSRSSAQVHTVPDRVKIEKTPALFQFFLFWWRFRPQQGTLTPLPFPPARPCTARALTAWSLAPEIHTWSDRRRSRCPMLVDKKAARKPTGFPH